MSGDGFRFEEALDRALANDPVPALSDGFAERVVAATEGRADPLPLPQTRAAPRRRWRGGRRLAVGAVAVLALGSAAAATGLLGDLPTPQEVWSTITGSRAPAEPSGDVPAAAPAPAPRAPESPAPVIIEGPIDTPEELEEAFRRVDEVRTQRRDTRRETVDERLDRAIQRRREQGLPAPTPEEEAQLRDRIERARDRADQRTAERIGERRDAMREDIESGGALSREDFLQRQRGGEPGTPMADRIERFREMTPEERRARLRELRERRLEQVAPPTTEPSPDPGTSR